MKKKKTTKTPRRVKRTPAKTAPATPATGTKRASGPAAAARRANVAFRKAALIRGDAAVEQGGELPPGATFSLEGFDAAGTPIIRRKRFSIT